MGSARLLASLSSDIEIITVAFVRMRSWCKALSSLLVWGYILTGCRYRTADCHVLDCDDDLDKHPIGQACLYTFDKVERINDVLYQDYQSIIEGRKSWHLTNTEQKNCIQMIFGPC